jgi:hypothetical protein
MIFSTLQKEYPQVLHEYLDEVGLLPILIVDHAQQILEVNKGFMRLLNLTDNPIGLYLPTFLQPQCRDLLSSIERGSSKTITLHFFQQNTSPIMMLSIAYHLDKGYVLIGEKIMQTNQETLEKMSIMNNELVTMAAELRRQKKALEEAHAKIKVLSGFLPICASCKKIRDDQGYWSQVEVFIREHSEAEFSHSICPDCMKQLYPEV